MKTIHRLMLLGLIFASVARLRAEPPAPLRGDFDDALLRKWVQPEYPAAAKAAKLEGEVVVEFVVEVEGSVSHARVKKTSDECFNASSLAAVQQWVFVSATVAGKPAASGMQVVVVFNLAQLKQKKIPMGPPLDLQLTALPMTKAKMIGQPSPDYPPELADRKIPGQVVLEFTVETDGTTSGPKVLWASHAAFVSEALLVLEKYRFNPAHQGPLVLTSPATEGQMEFDSLGASRAEVLAINQISVVDADKYTRLPRPIIFPEPVYPRELLLVGETGTATVSFSVTAQGTTADLLLTNSSRPEYGAALLAAVQAWVFDSPLLNNQAEAAQLVVAYSFSPPIDGAVHRLVLAMQPGGAGVGGAGGLDARLRPIWRIPPVYPQALSGEKPSGQAMIEFVVDNEGRCRLPRVVSASREEFGWAAAAAISQWVFARPTRGGQPTDVKVSIPVSFSALKE